MNYREYLDTLLAYLTEEQKMANDRAIYELDRLAHRMRKRVPKPLTTGNYYKCGRCGSVWKGKDVSYCWHCGTEIDWSNLR